MSQKTCQQKKGNYTSAVVCLIQQWNKTDSNILAHPKNNGHYDKHNRMENHGSTRNTRIPILPKHAEWI